MRLTVRLTLASLCLLILGACAGTVDNCPGGLGPPPGGSAIPGDRNASL